MFNFSYLKGLIIIIGEKVGGDFWFSCVLSWTENRIFVPVVNHTAVPFSIIKLALHIISTKIYWT